MLFNLFSRRKKLAASLRRPTPEQELPVVAAPSAEVETPATPPVATPEQTVDTTSDVSTAQESTPVVAEPEAPVPNATADVAEDAEPTAAESVETEPAVTEASDAEPTDAAVSETAAIADPEPDELDLTSLTVPVLRQRARDAGLTGYSRMKKSELIVALAASRDE